MAYIGSGAELQRAARGLFLSALRAGHGCTSFDPFLVMMAMAMVKMMNMKMITGVRLAKVGPIWLQNGAGTGHVEVIVEAMLARVGACLGIPTNKGNTGTWAKMRPRWAKMRPKGDSRWTP